jgi:tetratricopeptide (TPR) repeat protein
VVAAINVCGYDQDLQASLPLRQQVDTELAEAGTSPEVAAAAREMCLFYRDHLQSAAAHDLAQYVSLALNLGPPPEFAPVEKESDMPPDSTYVLGFVPLLKKYYATVGLHAIWMKHQQQYLDLITQYHEPVARMITSADNYLRMPTGAQGRSFTVYFEPMSAPSQVNSRNYRQDYYYVVVSPAGNNIHIDSIRHTYLLYELDPLIARKATALLRLKPILASVQKAPMAEEYKRDTGLLVVECLIRAIEARTADPKMAEKDREAVVQKDESEGFVLTGYFYQQLHDFEKANAGLQYVFSEWLHNIDVDREKKRASQIAFAPQPGPEVIPAAKPASHQKLILAENALASGNAEQASTLAQQALQENEDASQAYFILARAAIINSDMQGAQENFQKALQSAKDPRIAAWSHVYLGRIYDLQQERETALAQYTAALSIGDGPTEARKAAERGLKEPYQPPAAKKDQ